MLAAFRLRLPLAARALGARTFFVKRYSSTHDILAQDALYGIVEMIANAKKADDRNQLFRIFQALRAQVRELNLY
jgi:hypothetical protein